MHTDILTARSFNQIPRFDEQAHTVGNSALQALGELFVEHDMHRNYCVGLLHRHFDLQDGQIMIHEPPRCHGVICKAQNICDIQRSKLVPHSIFLNDELKFQPYEYELSSEQHGIDPDFLASLRALLIALNLQNIFSVTRRADSSTPDRVAVETLLPEISGMHTAYLNAERSAMQCEHSTVTTLWGFQKDFKGDVKILELQRCVKNAAGVHDVKD